MDYKNYVFDFERLEVYQKALDFTDAVFKTTMNFRKEIQYSLGDQFRRATLSVCNNIAEGSRKDTRSRKLFYSYALDSARECIPMISLAVKQEQITKIQKDELHLQCIRVCSMVYKLRASVN